VERQYNNHNKNIHGKSLANVFKYFGTS